MQGTSNGTGVLVGIVLRSVVTFLWTISSSVIGFVDPRLSTHWTRRVCTFPSLSLQPRRNATPVVPVTTTTFLNNRQAILVGLELVRVVFCVALQTTALLEIRLTLHTLRILARLVERFTANATTRVFAFCRRHRIGGKQLRMRRDNAWDNLPSR